MYGGRMKKNDWRGKVYCLGDVPTIKVYKTPEQREKEKKHAEEVTKRLFSEIKY
jgi:hypothetical protein